MKRLFLGLIFAILSTGIYSQNQHIDTNAVAAINKMADIIGDLHSCSFTLNVSQDVPDVDLGLVKYFNVHQVKMVGPDKMLVNTTGYKGHRGFWYNGNQLNYYSYSENNYVKIDVSATIMEMIDSVNTTYGFDFPAADLFYPTLTEDLVYISDDLVLAGTSNINGTDCFKVVAKNEDIGIQIWISNDAMFLPMKLVIVYYDKTPNEQYEATFSNWILNPDLPDALFEFNPPANASEVRIKSKSE